MKQSIYNFGKVGRRMVIYLVFFYLSVSVIPPTLTVGIPALCAQYGWDYAQLMSVNTFGGWLSIPITLIFASIVDKKGNRWPSLIIMILCAAAIFGMAAPILPVFLVSLLLENALNNAPTMVTPNAMVAEWFPRKKGIVLGIVSTGLLLGGVVVLPVFSAVTEAVNVHAAYIVLAVYVLIVGLAIVFFKDRPEDMGCYPDNDPTYVRPVREENATTYKLTSYLKQGKFWLLVLSFGLAFLAMMILVSTGTQILAEAGISGGMSIGVIVIGSVFGIIGSVALGYVRVDFLEQVVLGEIRRLTKFTSQFEDEFVKAVIGHSQQAEATDRKLKEKELKALQARDEELDGLFERIYEDNVSGKLSDDRFARMSRRYEEEQKELAEKIKALRAEIDKQSSQSMTTDMFISLVRKYTRARKLTPRMLNELIEKIEVFNAEKIDGVWEQRLRIHYNCVGVIEIPELIPLPAPEVSVNTRKGVVVNYAPSTIAG